MTVANAMKRFILGRFTEDGSFIGQYGQGIQKSKKSGDAKPPPSPTAIATYV